MKQWKSQWIGYLWVAGLTMVTACTLDEPSSSDNSPALTLHASQNLSLTDLTWDQVNVTGFKEYIILQSSSDIPNNPTPTVNAEVSIVKRINDMEVTSLSVSPVLFSTNIYYKLYCAVDDRFLYSSTLCIEQDLTSIPGFYDRACHESGNDKMVMFDRVNDHFSTFNYKTGEITQTVNDIGLNFPSMEMSTWDNVTHVFAFDQSPPWLRKYNFPSLNPTDTKSYSQILWSANAYNQYVFIAQEELGKGFQVLNRNTLNAIDTRPGMTGNQNIAVFPGNPVTVLTLGDAGSIKYTLDANGKVQSEEPIPATIIQPDLQSTCAEGSEVFIGGRQGSIVKRNGENAGLLNSGQNSFINLIRLSPDERTAVFLINENGIQRLEYADISNLPIVTNLQRYDVPALNYADIIVEEEIVYLIGTIFSNNGQPQTFVFKYPI